MSGGFWEREELAGAGAGNAKSTEEKAATAGAGSDGAAAADVAETAAAVAEPETEAEAAAAECWAAADAVDAAMAESRARNNIAGAEENKKKCRVVARARFRDSLRGRRRKGCREELEVVP